MESEVQSRLRGQRRMGSQGASAQQPFQSQYCDREVLCSMLDHNPCGLPDNLKNWIINERPSKTKRLLDESFEEDQPMHGDFKKPRLMLPYCSTPNPPSQKEPFSSPDSAYVPGSSSCFDETQPGKLVPRISMSLPNDPLAHSSLASNQEQNEIDDSLLEATDDEADSPLPWTEEEMQKMLEDNSPATEVERELFYSVPCSPEESEELSLPLSQSSSGSPPSSFLTLDITKGERSFCLEDNYLKSKKNVIIPFDCEIEDILALSPANGFLEQEGEEYVLVESTEEQDDCLSKESKGATDFPTEQEFVTLSDLQLVNEEPGEYAAEPEGLPLCLEECAAAPGEQAPCSPSVLNPSGDMDLCRAQVGTSSEEVASEVHLFKSINVPAEEGPGSAGEGVNASFQKPQLVEEAAVSPDAMLKEVTSAEDDNGENLQRKKSGKAALPKTEGRPVRISFAELEKRKQIYVQSVLEHHKSAKETNQDTYKEWLTLMDQYGSKDWQHPLNLTMRYYPRFSTKPQNKCSLEQWVKRNGGHQRFKHLANRFQRSSVVALP